MDAYLVDGARTPIGDFGGSLAPLRATQFATAVASALLERNAVPASAIELVTGGMVVQDMTESNPARIVAQRIGVPSSTPAFTVNMQCTSGMVALILAAQQIALGAVECALALGMESMSNAPYMVDGPRWGLRYGHARFTDALDECKLAGSRMWGDPHDMIDVAEHHAAVDGVSREEMDAHAVVSHRRALEAIDGGRLDGEVVPIEVTRRRETLRFAADEHPRRDISMETLARLPPVRPGGTITAGNAASHNDGAAAALLCSRAALARLGVEPLARVDVRATAMVGCDPQLMGRSANVAAERALERADLTLADIDLLECNEGFAVQMVACARRGGWPSDRTNVDGGSVGLGHPVGMSGLRIAIHLAAALRQRDLRRGLATVPAGSGLGSAVILERP